MKSQLLITSLFLAATTASAQSYTSYVVGDTSNVNTITTPGLCLMGGATENDSAMTWWLSRAGGGDIVVLRASGADGYNTYLYTDLGLTVNSVETIVFNNASAASDPYVRRKIAGAEAIWIAGGDQSNYVNYWKGTGIDSILNYLANTKGIPMGGTSAGMMVLGWNYYSAQFNSVTSAAALANPFNADMTLGQDDFLKMPWMKHVITDTHYDNPDRKGRHMAFLSRLMTGSGDTVRGIACDEYTAVCIDAAGKARVYGEFPTEDDNAYFLRVNCALPNNPETITNGQPLNWVRSNAAVKVYAVKGTMNGANFLNLTDWKTGTGGSWEHWWVNNGTLQTGAGTMPNCLTSVENVNPQNVSLKLYPNPAEGRLFIESAVSQTMRLYAVDGRVVLEHALQSGRNELSLESIPSGVYYVQGNGMMTKLVVQ